MEASTPSFFFDQFFNPPVSTQDDISQSGPDQEPQLFESRANHPDINLKGILSSNLLMTYPPLTTEVFNPPAGPAAAPATSASEKGADHQDNSPSREIANLNNFDNFGDWLRDSTEDPEFDDRTNN